MIHGGKDLNHITNTLQILLKQLQNWGNTCGLKFSPEKTVAVLFNGQGREIARPMKIDNRKIKYVTEVKDLGLTLDHKLSWKPHVTKTLERCTTLMRALISKTKGLYGPKPKVMKWLYTGIIRPKITYGSIIWSHKINNKCYKKQLKQLNRIACSAATTIERTTPQGVLQSVRHRGSKNSDISRLQKFQHCIRLGS